MSLLARKLRSARFKAEKRFRTSSSRSRKPSASSSRLVAVDRSTTHGKGEIEVSNPYPAARNLRPRTPAQILADPDNAVARKVFVCRQSVPKAAALDPRTGICLRAYARGGQCRSGLFAWRRQRSTSFES